MNGSVVSSYGYDSNGNRTSSGLNWSQLGYATDADESLTPADTEYESADKLVRHGTRTYSWNAVGQLESMHDPATGETTSFEYDLFGNLLRVALGASSAEILRSAETEGRTRTRAYAQLRNPIIPYEAR